MVGTDIEPDSEGNSQLTPLESMNFPVATISKSEVMHNICWMQDFSEHYQVNLAPHGKTTMLPALFSMQLKAGAWGMTLATVEQVLTAYQHGVKRILMANQLVGRRAIELISECLQDPEFTFYCLVDSVACAEQLSEHLSATGQTIKVLLEVGVEGGRAGCRSESQAQELADAITRIENITLCGVEFYEGMLANPGPERIADFVDNVITLTGKLYQKGYFEEHFPIISGAGSAWYDIVAEVFSKRNQPSWFIPVIRPGCYVTHDQGIYQHAQDLIDVRNQYAVSNQPSLISCLEVWAYVLSVPEPGKAIVGLGKRNCAYDAGLPKAVKWLPQPHKDSGSKSVCSIDAIHTHKIMDQHCIVSFQQHLPIQVGDVLGFTTSHPCLTLDKWRNVLLVDSNYRVEQIMNTYF